MCTRARADGGICCWQARGQAADVAVDVAVELTELELEEEEALHPPKKKGAPAKAAKKAPAKSAAKSAAAQAVVKPKVRCL